MLLVGGWPIPSFSNHGRRKPKQPQSTSMIVQWVEPRQSGHYALQTLFKYYITASSLQQCHASAITKGQHKNALLTFSLKDPGKDMRRKKASPTEGRPLQHGPSTSRSCSNQEAHQPLRHPIDVWPIFQEPRNFYVKTLLQWKSKGVSPNPALASASMKKAQHTLN